MSPVWRLRRRQSARDEPSTDAGKRPGYLPIEGHRTVAAPQFGGVQRLIGGFDEVCDAVEMSLGAVRGTADGDRYRGVIRSDDMPGVAKGHHDAFANAARRLGIGCRQCHDEL